jgi:hypothetical protein
LKGNTGIKQKLQLLLQRKPSPLQSGGNLPYVFVHINKTAGTSVGKAIGLSTKNHLTVKEIISEIGQFQWENAYKFTFVRNPWDKTVSLYEYRRKKNKTQIAKREISFEEWVNKTIGEDQDSFFYDNPKSFQPQVEWLKNSEDQILIDYIGKFESLNEDFEKIRTIVGVEAQLPHLNASSRAPYQSYYSNKTREAVSRWFGEDIEHFKYKFEP